MACAAAELAWSLCFSCRHCLGSPARANLNSVGTTWAKQLHRLAPNIPAKKLTLVRCCRWLQLADTRFDRVTAPGEDNRRRGGCGLAGAPRRPFCSRAYTMGKHGEVLAWNHI